MLFSEIRVLGPDADNLRGIRALVDTFRGGFADLRLLTVMVSVAAALTAIATSLVLANPMIQQLDAVVETGVLRRSAVIVNVDRSVDEGGLAVEGVEAIGTSTGHDLNKVGVEGNVEEYRTLDLDGTVPAAVVVDQVRSMVGVGDAYVRRGIRVAPTLDRGLELLPIVAPIAIGVWAIALLMLMGSVLRRAGRSTLAATWARWSIVVLTPMVATVFLVSVIASILWPPVARPMISSLAVGDISGPALLDSGVTWGLRALAFAWVILTVMAIASTFARHGRHG